MASLLLLCAAHPPSALAHPGEPIAPHDLWTAWNWEPGILIGLALAAGVYGRGVGRLWRRAGFERGLRRGQVAAFGGGLITLWIALISPLDALSNVLFSAHMVQHMLLILIAPPLLVLSGFPIALVWALPRSSRRRWGRWWKRQVVGPAVWHGLSQPLFVWGLAGGIFWLWHLPRLYQAALVSEPIHALEHATFLGTALLFWWVLLQPQGHRRLSYGAGVLFVFTTALQNSLLGALLTFAPQPWYPIYSIGAAAWGLTPLEDQQLAGLIMWIPAGVIYLLTALALFVRWLQTIERAMQQRERRTLNAADAPGRMEISPNEF